MSELAECHDSIYEMHHKHAPVGKARLRAGMSFCWAVIFICWTSSLQAQQRRSLVSSGVYSIEMAAAERSQLLEELAKQMSGADWNKKIFSKALDLAQMNLKYQYGGNRPEVGGMDCSGTTQFLLTAVGYKNVPRQANTIYLWMGEEHKLERLEEDLSATEFFAKIQPGDLIFWRGTYKVKRVPDVTHVMVYLGAAGEGDGRRHFVFGGRTERMLGIHGAAIDMHLLRFPKPSSEAKIIAIGRLQTMEKNDGASEKKQSGSSASIFCCWLFCGAPG